MEKSFISLDGFQRNRINDARISTDIAALFNTELGQEVFKYLKSITIDAVNGPNVTDAELRQLEGLRYIVGLIDRRIQHAHRVKNERAS